VNAAAQEKDPASVLNYFRKMVRLRKENLALVYGSYEVIDPLNPNVYAYTRVMDGKKLLVLLNFKGTPSTINTTIDFSKAGILAGNYPKPLRSRQLRPYEAVIYSL
jgi:oligo-1,6-glucosidase